MRAFLATLLVLCFVMPVALAAPTRVETHSYGALPFVACATQVVAGQHDGSCFDIRPADASVAIRVRDQSGLSMGWSWSQFAEDGVTVLAAGQVCGDRTVPITDGAARLLVRVVNLPQNVVFYCGPIANGVPGSATTGTVQASFFA